MSRQYFTYKLNGDQRHFLILRDEYDWCVDRMKELDWSVADAFERLTGKAFEGVTDIKLHLELMDNSTED